MLENEFKWYYYELIQFEKLISILKDLNLRKTQFLNKVHKF